MAVVFDSFDELPCGDDSAFVEKAFYEPCSGESGIVVFKKVEFACPPIRRFPRLNGFADQDITVLNGDFQVEGLIPVECFEPLPPGRKR